MPTIDFTHDPATRSWVESAQGHPDFPVQNLPLGMFSSHGGKPCPGIAIGDKILDLRAVAPLLPADAAALLDLVTDDTLNALLGAGEGALRTLRHGVFALLTDTAQAEEVRPHLHAAVDCTMHMPVAVGDYTDFYSGIHHALNIGKQFRPDNPLLPNYKHVPIGYHGRSSSIRVSGEDVIRPVGQQKPEQDGGEPRFGPAARLDYEMEMAIWVGKGNALGHPVPIGEASQHIAGMSILNDWSARDLQAWEYQPLGPFLAKNFHSTVSPWIVTGDALAPFRMAQPDRPAGDPKPLPYLWDDEDQQTGAFAITMEVHLHTTRMRDAGDPPVRLSKGPMSAMYWTAAQLLAHHSVNGCNLRPGDLLGTGTLSDAEDATRGSLMEISEGGKHPLALPNGETRSFLKDGDEIIMTAYGDKAGAVRIGFGACRAIVRPAPAIGK
ncbi:fumarylacetoacetase [Croceicoccus sp. F390]|uniref:fumarylacetoacetase n=1 Tax=Croceicoccus esteveae TaxID=3075597 RepID=A0ABU2ZF08_9SPHN|nr:fumarylacetoacetase [Croceicoccus sp. F390]MDT0574980.1 fumarylacetoacetase [Croceicoccus sp. F390]